MAGSIGFMGALAPGGHGGPPLPLEPAVGSEGPKRWVSGLEAWALGPGGVAREQLTDGCEQVGGAKRLG